MTDAIEITRDGLLVRVQSGRGYIELRDINALLMYEILQELKTLNCNVIDVENAIERLVR